MNEIPAGGGPAARAAPFISRVRVRNYKSIGRCDVRLGPLAVLVGPNGSGKSHFLGALDFLCRAVATSPGLALEEHGGLNAVLRQGPGHPGSFSIAVEAGLPGWPAQPGSAASYALEIGRAQNAARGVTVLHESCELREPGGAAVAFSAASGQARLTLATGRSLKAFAVEPGRLFLPAAASHAGFASLYASLTRPAFYSFRTGSLRRPQRSAACPVLRRHGEGLAEVLAALSARPGAAKARVDAYLSAIVPGATGIGAREVNGRQAVVLRTDVNGSAFEFGPEAISDGTVRSAAVLAALFQPRALSGELPLVGIEEPGTALHPAVAGVLFDAITEASGHVQVIATSQSADLLDREDLDPAVIRAVAMRDGLTVIGEVDEASQETARRKLYTLGELMRASQLSPETGQEAAPGR